MVFRDRKKLSDDRKVLVRYGLDWKKFTALERSLLALSLVGQDRNWFDDYQCFLGGVKSLGHSVTVVSSHISTRSLPYSLLVHFLSSTGLSLEHDDLGSFDVHKNHSFNRALIHAMSTNLSALQPHQQSFFPGPHEGNRWLFRVCKRLASIDQLMTKFHTIFSSDLKNALVGHLDSRASSSNQQYCELMSVDFDYFKPSDQAKLLSDDELIALANDTSQSRNYQEIEHFNRQIENACMQRMRAEIVSS